MARCPWPPNIFGYAKWTQKLKCFSCFGRYGFWLVTFFVCLLIIENCNGRPDPLQLKSNMSGTAVSVAVDFLTKYGYLGPSSSAGNLRSEDQLRNAIRSLQRFANIPTTGVIDHQTLELMNRPRCGVPDILDVPGLRRLKRYSLQGQKWHTTNLTWSIKEPNGANASMVRSQLARAFAVWSEASVLTFSETSSDDADIVVSFPRGPHGDGFPFDGAGAVLAHAFFPGEGIGGDAHFDAEEFWLPHRHPALDKDEGVNLFAVAAHEIGHSLGLSHSSAPGSLMFPYYQVMEENFKLPADDAYGIQQLYGPKDNTKLATMPIMIPTDPESSTTQKDDDISTTAAVTQVYSTDTEMDNERDDKEKKHIDSPPDTCNTSIDAISVIRREVFIFKGQYFWRLDSNKTLRKGYPVPINRFWYNLPHNIDKIDALYQRPTDTKIVFFSGKNYWVFTANQAEPGYPRPITELGLGDEVTHIDAAMVWGHNGKTYLFSGSRYWKLDEHDGVVELDYPRDIGAWRGIPHKIDAAFQWTDGNTYFFKDKKYWKFNDHKMKAHPIPGDTSKFWFGCSIMEESIPPTTEKLNVQYFETSINGATQVLLCDILFILTFCIILITEVLKEK